MKPITDFDTYQAATCRTASPDTTLVVCALGLSGEVGELWEELSGPRYHLGLNIDSVIKELGDVLWYTAQLSERLGVKLSAIAPECISATSMTIANTPSLIVSVGKINDHIKKHIGQGHELNAGYLMRRLTDALAELMRLARSVDVTLSEVFTKNIERLAARYPDGFSVESSVNRSE
jgi:NTP pyrophosphatase (non-canonical NTP hydrolase)